MIQQQKLQEDCVKQEIKEDGGIVALYPEESRNDPGHKTSIKKRISSNDSSPSSSFENKIGKRYQSNSEFKIHFYVHHVHMNGMSDNEFLSFIKRKVNLAGSCEIVQMFNQQGSFCDVAIGMSNDDNAKLVYIGKKHFNFGRNGRQKEIVELSDSFQNYLENKKMLDKEQLERSLRRNQQFKGRSDSSESSRRYKSRSISKKKKNKRLDNKQVWQGSKRKSPSSSSEPRKVKKIKKNRHSSYSSSRESIKESVQPIKPQQVYTNKNTIYIFSIPQEVNEKEVIQEIMQHHKQSAPISDIWNSLDQMQFLELQFQDENTVQFLCNLRPCLHVKGIPLLVVSKKQRPVLELIRNYQVQVELDKDVLAFNVYQEFKKYGDLIGIYVFQLNRNYLLLYSSSSQLQEVLRPPVHLQLTINDQIVNANAKIIDKPIDIQRPLIQETLAYQLKNQIDEDDDENKKRKNKRKVEKSQKK
ncbi:unnamed protein product [Paramecium pentaurelia]|uniref:Uncharacterized protein n=1 Tax=Paramecium pentaurelia TaxID=43138 RepID=A0A8S1WHH2_9CILI|nr:unnamed protein product [Paramecium pentaurelia]